MTTPTSHFRIGLFVLTGMAILVLALFMFGARSQFEKRTTFESYIEGDVEGLSLGSVVMLRGVVVGKVTHIGFAAKDYPADTNGYVRVLFEIPSSQNPWRSDQPLEQLLGEQIEKGLRVRVKGQGITGTSVVAMDYVKEFPNWAPPWVPRHHYIPSAPAQFTQILNSIGKSLQRIEQLDIEALQSRLGLLLTNVDEVVLDVKKIQFAGIGTNVSELVAELKHTNVKLQSFIEHTESRIKEVDLAGLVKEGKSTLERISGSAGNFDKALAGFERTLGGLDTAAMNGALSNARAAAAELDAALRELRRYPSGFILGKPPAPARSVQHPTRK